VEHVLAVDLWLESGACGSLLEVGGWAVDVDVLSSRRDGRLRLSFRLHWEAKPEPGHASQAAFDLSKQACLHGLGASLAACGPVAPCPSLDICGSAAWGVPSIPSPNGR